MAVSIRCGCTFSQDQSCWNLEWATLGPRRKVDKEVAFPLRPAQLVQLINYLEGLLADPPLPIDRPDLEPVAFRVRYRRNANLYELRVRSETGSLNAMVEKPQLEHVLDYLQKCLQGYAIAVYEGRTPVPEGYPEGYPEPHF